MLLLAMSQTLRQCNVHIKIISNSLQILPTSNTYLKLIKRFYQEVKVRLRSCQKINVSPRNKEVLLKGHALARKYKGFAKRYMFS
jgi:hypothetical protein